MRNTRLLNIFLALYILASCYGAFWIGDEFNQERQNFFAYIAIPLAFIFMSSFALWPYWAQRFSKLYRNFIICLLILFTWGNLLLLNAISGNQGLTQNTVYKSDLAERGMVGHVRRGGFGWLYRKRW